MEEGEKTGFRAGCYGGNFLVHGDGLTLSATIIHGNCRKVSGLLQEETWQVNNGPYLIWSFGKPPRVGGVPEWKSPPSQASAIRERQTFQMNQIGFWESPYSWLWIARAFPIWEA